MEDLIYIDVDKIKVGDRIRVENGNLEELSESIRQMGLICPICIDKENNLIAGFRRLSAWRLLRAKHGDDYALVPTRILTSDEDPVLVEMEENLRRKQMTWKEKALGIAEYHRRAKHEATRKHAAWLQQNTADLFDIAQSDISVLLRVAKDLQLHPEKYKDCQSATDAACILLKEHMDKSAKRLIDQIAQKVPPSETANLAAPSAVVGIAESQEIKVRRIMSQVHNTDCLEYLKTAPIFDHIICDPPYAIDMDPVSSSDRVKSEHAVLPNIQLLRSFIDLAYHHTKKFLVMFCDPSHFDFLSSCCKKAGFSVCRWPFVWVKTSRCLNNQAYINMTKTCEFALVARIESALLVQPANAHYIGPSVANEIHPFIKPQPLWTHLFQTFVAPGETVLDPFCGCGSSLRAADALGINITGVELNSTHYNLIPSFLTS
jgi:ParB-like chromosome segregation protein Spo0J